MSSYWPDIADTKTARDAALQGFGAAAFIASVTTIMSVASLIVHHPVFGIDGYGLIDAALFGVVAWRVYRMSRAWAVVGLVLYSTEITFKLVHGDFRNAGVVLTFFMFVGFIGGVRGTFAARAYQSNPLKETTEAVRTV